MVLVLGGNAALAETYKMSKSAGGTCGDITVRAMLPLNMVMDAPADATVEDMSVDKAPGSRLFSEDYKWAVRVIAATKRDLDFAKAKKEVIARAKKSGNKLAWKASGRTADGYRLLYTTTEKDGTTSYTTIYLRTLEKKKWVCWNDSEWADSHECVAKACESLRTPPP